MQGAPYATPRPDVAGGRPKISLNLSTLRTATTAAPAKEDPNGVWSGSFSNRVLLALQSNLINEMTWALNVLIRVSAKDALHSLQSIPPLLDAVVEVLDHTLHALWKDIVANPRKLLAIKTTGLLSGDTIAADREMALAALHVLTNFSWLEQTAETLAKDPAIVTAIEIAMQLGQLDRELFGELHMYALSLLDNLANKVVVDPRNDSLVSSLCRSLLEVDRREVIAAIRSILRICHRDSNSKEVIPIANTDEVVERLVAFLLLRAQDGELAYYAVELLHRIAQGVHDGGKRIMDIGGTFVVRELVFFLKEEARHLPDPFDAATKHFVPPPQLAEKLKPINMANAPPGKDPAAVAAANSWISSHLIKGAEQAPINVLHSMYVNHCMVHGLKPVLATDLVQLITAQLGTTTFTDPVSRVAMLQGLRLKNPVVRRVDSPAPSDSQAESSADSPSMETSTVETPAATTEAPTPSMPEASIHQAEGDAMNVDLPPAAPSIPSVHEPTLEKAEPAVEAHPPVAAAIDEDQPMTDVVAAVPVPQDTSGPSVSGAAPASIAATEPGQAAPSASPLLSTIPAPAFPAPPAPAGAAAEVAALMSLAPGPSPTAAGPAVPSPSPSTSAAPATTTTAPAAAAAPKLPLRCHWHGCHESFEERALLRQHILGEHVNSPSGALICRWRSCARYPVSRSAPDRATLAAHVKTHDPWNNQPAQPPAKPPAPPAKQQPPPYTKPPPMAVTCATLLANLVSHDSEHKLAILEEGDLSWLGTHALLAPLVGQIIANCMEA